MEELINKSEEMIRKSKRDIELRNEFESIVAEFNKRLDEFYERNNLCKYYSYHVRLDLDDDPFGKICKWTLDGQEIVQNMGFREHLNFVFTPHYLTPKSNPNTPQE